MTKPGKSPKKKTKEKSPQRTEESEYPAMVFTDIHFENLKKSIAHEAYHLSHGLCQ
jgi:hypothetical protein